MEKCTVRFVDGDDRRISSLHKLKYVRKQLSLLEELESVSGECLDY